MAIVYNLKVIQTQHISFNKWLIVFRHLFHVVLYESAVYVI